MANPTDKNPSFFQKIAEAGHAYLDSQIRKAKTDIMNAPVDEDIYFDRAIVEDPTYAIHSQGYKEKTNRLQQSHLKQMAYQDTAVGAVIQTRQNQVANHTRLVKSEDEKGWMIKLADEDALLEKMKEKLKGADKSDKQDNSQEGEDFNKAEDVETQPADTQDQADKTSMEGADNSDDKEDDSKSDDEVEAVDWELERKARTKLNKKFEKARKKVESYIQNCGLVENRPFESKQWNFEAAMRAIVRDTLTYDLYAVNVTPDLVGRPHHWFPIDAGTVRFASEDLRKYKDFAQTFNNIDILYPERQQEKEERQEAIELDPQLLEKGMYRYVQVVRGKIERAFTADELKVGIRNANTDIYNTGYGISELELLVSMVTGHLNAEYYNQAYFTQGFSAKGILHIQAAINRRKLETVRMQWQHMLKGTKNSFQTPIFAGVEDVKWIPLTQNHNDIGFEGWMRYLITMISAIYQIDPAEMGMNFKSEGSGGSLNNSNDQSTKLDHSKDKGLYPLLRHLENFINEQIIKPFDARFVIKFTGMDGETQAEVLDRTEKEVKTFKTVNEVREERGLPPLPGCDDIILDSNYMTWYASFSEKGMKKTEDDRKAQQDQQKAQQDHEKGMASIGSKDSEEEENAPTDEHIYGDDAMDVPAEPFMEKPESPVKKSLPLVVEVYKIEK
jgi:hypothetical protein